MQCIANTEHVSLRVFIVSGCLPIHLSPNRSSCILALVLLPRRPPPFFFFFFFFFFDSQSFRLMRLCTQRHSGTAKHSELCTVPWTGARGSRAENQRALLQTRTRTYTHIHHLTHILTHHTLTHTRCCTCGKQDCDKRGNQRYPGAVERVCCK